MLPVYRSTRAKLIANDSGQAMVEFAFIVPLLLIMMCAAIDFGRALNTMQVIAELTRQGSSLASRVNTCAAGASLPQPQEPMETLTCSGLAVVAGESGLDIGTYGEVIMTAVENTGTTASPIYMIIGQYTNGGISQTSHVGTWTGSNTAATVPAAFSTAKGDQPLQAGQTMYVTEIYYTFTPITPIGKLTKSVVNMSTLLYNVAYF